MVLEVRGHISAAVTGRNTRLMFAGSEPWVASRTWWYCDLSGHWVEFVFETGKNTMTLPLFLCLFLMEFNLFYRHIAFGNVSMGLRQSWTKNKLRNKTPLPPCQWWARAQTKTLFFSSLKWRRGEGGTQIVHLFWPRWRVSVGFVIIASNITVFAYSIYTFVYSFPAHPSGSERYSAICVLL